MSRAAPSPAPDTSAVHDGGQFSLGFVLGVLGGVAGMYLFGTKQGHQTLEMLREEIGKTINQSPGAQAVEKQLLGAADSAATVVKSEVKRLSTKFPAFKRRA